MRLLVECTHVYNHPHSNSGIQRVVRNISRQLVQHPLALDCIPVTYKKNAVYRILELTPSRLQRTLARVWQRLEMRRQSFWITHANIEQRASFSNSRNLRRALYVAAHLLDLIFLLPIGAVRFALHRIIDRVKLQKLEIESDDVLLLLDSTWQPVFFKLTESLKAKGLRVISVIYDVIPVTHPHFFEITLATTYQRWFQWIAGVADGFIAISKTVASEARTAMTEYCNDRSKQPWFDHFYLGSELDLIDPTRAASADISASFAEGRAVYLAVSTVEPRKNQTYLLDAFELLWDKDLPVTLCIVGRIGWKCENFMRRVRTHAEFGRRLFMHNDASDTDLNYCYMHAKALLCPSIAEGFGLPIVEAMQRGLPVMASDIPIFREVGSDFIAYFDLDKPMSLAQLVTRFEETGEFPAQRAVHDWQWIDWHAAANMLVTKVLEHVEPQRAINGLCDEPVTRANPS